MKRVPSASDWTCTLPTWALDDGAGDREPESAALAALLEPNEALEKAIPG